MTMFGCCKSLQTEFCFSVRNLSLAYISCTPRLAEFPIFGNLHVLQNALLSGPSTFEYLKLQSPLWHFVCKLYTNWIRRPSGQGSDPVISIIIPWKKSRAGTLYLRQFENILLTNSRSRKTRDNEAKPTFQRITFSFPERIQASVPCPSPEHYYGSFPERFQGYIRGPWPEHDCGWFKGTTTPFYRQRL